MGNCLLRLGPVPSVRDGPPFSATAFVCLTSPVRVSELVPHGRGHQSISDRRS